MSKKMDGAGNIVRTEKAGADGSHTFSAYGYDEYGQRVFIKYGNGVTTDYTYDALYQLTGASGKTRSTHATADRPSYTASYRQTFTFSGDDAIKQIQDVCGTIGVN
jgi:hypothetical protein